MDLVQDRIHYEPHSHVASILSRSLCSIYNQGAVIRITAPCYITELPGLLFIYPQHAVHFYSFHVYLLPWPFSLLSVHLAVQLAINALCAIRLKPLTKDTLTKGLGNHSPQGSSENYSSTVTGSTSFEYWSEHLPEQWSRSVISVNSQWEVRRGLKPR